MAEKRLDTVPDAAHAPCPFCRGDHVGIRMSDFGEPWVECQDCAARGPIVIEVPDPQGPLFIGEAMAHVWTGASAWRVAQAWERWDRRDLKRRIPTTISGEGVAQLLRDDFGAAVWWDAGAQRLIVSPASLETICSLTDGMGVSLWQVGIGGEPSRIMGFSYSVEETPYGS